MTWNFCAMGSNPRAKDLRNQKRFILFLGDLWQAKSASTSRPRSSICPLTYNAIADTRTWPFSFTYSTSLRCITRKLNEQNQKATPPYRLHSSTKSIGMIKFWFKEATQGAIFICNSLYQNGHGVSEAQCQYVPTHIHMHMDSRLSVWGCCWLKAPPCLWKENISHLLSWAAACG